MLNNKSRNSPVEVTFLLLLFLFGSWTECVTADDCNCLRGVCQLETVNTTAGTVTQASCLCPPGFFGENCQYFVANNFNGSCSNIHEYIQSGALTSDILVQFENNCSLSSDENSFVEGSSDYSSVLLSSLPSLNSGISYSSEEESVASLLSSSSGLGSQSDSLSTEEHVSNSGSSLSLSSQSFSSETSGESSSAPLSFSVSGSLSDEKSDIPSTIESSLTVDESSASLLLSSSDTNEQSGESSSMRFESSLPNTNAENTSDSFSFSVSGYFPSISFLSSSSEQFSEQFDSSSVPKNVQDSSEENFSSGSSTPSSPGENIVFSRDICRQSQVQRSASISRRGVQVVLQREALGLSQTDFCGTFPNDIAFVMEIDRENIDVIEIQLGSLIVTMEIIASSSTRAADAVNRLSSTVASQTSSVLSSWSVASVSNVVLSPPPTTLIAAAAEVQSRSSQTGVVFTQASTGLTGTPLILAITLPSVLGGVLVGVGLVLGGMQAMRASRHRKRLKRLKTVSRAYKKKILAEHFVDQIKNSRTRAYEAALEEEEFVAQKDSVRPGVTLEELEKATLPSSWISTIKMSASRTITAQSKFSLAVARLGGNSVYVDRSHFRVSPASLQMPDSESKTKCLLKEPLPVLGKVLPDSVTASEYLAEEACFWKLNPHRNVEEVLGIEKILDGYRTVSRLYSNGSLKKAYQKTGRMSTAEVVQFACGIVAGLTHFHKLHTVYGCLTPSKILMDGDRHPRLHAIIPPWIKRIDSLIGSGFELYVAPETLANRDTPTSALDIFAFGALLWELLEDKLRMRRIDYINRLKSHGLSDPIEADGPATAPKDDKPTATDPLSLPKTQTYVDVDEALRTKLLELGMECFENQRPKVLYAIALACLRRDPRSRPSLRGLQRCLQDVLTLEISRKRKITLELRSESKQTVGGLKTVENPRQESAELPRGTLAKALSGKLREFKFKSKEMVVIAKEKFDRHDMRRLQKASTFYATMKKMMREYEERSDSLMTSLENERARQMQALSALEQARARRSAKASNEPSQI